MESFKSNNNNINKFRYVLEAENRLRKNLEERINKLQENVENINIKMSLVDNKTSNNKK